MGLLGGEAAAGQADRPQEGPAACLVWLKLDVELELGRRGAAGGADRGPCSASDHHDRVRFSGYFQKKKRP